MTFHMSVTSWDTVAQKVEDIVDGEAVDMSALEPLPPCRLGNGFVLPLAWRMCRAYPKTAFITVRVARGRPT